MMSVSKRKDFQDFFKQRDVFVLDRRFKEAIQPMKKLGFQVEIPAFLQKTKDKRMQLSWQEANRSRKVTKVKFAVECVIGKLKSKFRYLDKFVSNLSLKQILRDFRIAGSLLNRFFYCN